MELISRAPRREAETFQEVPVMLMLTDFRKPPAEALGEARKLLLKWARDNFPNLPPEADQGKAFDLDSPGDPLRVLVPSGNADDYWALRLNRIDEEVAGRVWTVEAHLASSGDRAFFGFRMLVRSDGNHILRQPRFVRDISERIGLSIDGFPLDVRVREVGEGKGTDALIELIERENRAAPVVVFSKDADGNYRDKAGSNFAKMARGLAHVFAVDEAGSYQLSRRFGKALSTYNGAIRVYPPRFSDHSDPHSMPLYFHGRYNQVSDSRLADWLMSDVCAMSTVDFNSGALPRFSALRQAQATYQINRAKKDVESSAANSDEQFAAMQEQISKFSELEAIFNESLRSAEREAKTFKERSEEYSSENHRLRAHIEALTAALRAQGDSSASVPIPDSYEDLQDWVEQHYPTSLAITNKAARLAAAGVYQDVDKVYKALQLLATEYRASKMGSEGAYERFEAGLQELGLKITPTFANGSAGASGADAIQKYRGINRTMEWHIKTGGNTRDPERCLRIYFFWSDEDQMCVVGALPAHIETIMS